MLEWHTSRVLALEKLNKGIPNSTIGLYYRSINCLSFFIVLIPLFQDWLSASPPSFTLLPPTHYHRANWFIHILGLNLLPTVSLLFCVWKWKDLIGYCWKDTEANSQFSCGVLLISLCTTFFPWWQNSPLHGNNKKIKVNSFQLLIVVVTQQRSTKVDELQLWKLN